MPEQKITGYVVRNADGRYWADADEIENWSEDLADARIYRVDDADQLLQLSRRFAGKDLVPVTLSITLSCDAKPAEADTDGDHTATLPSGESVHVLYWEASRETPEALGSGSAFDLVQRAESEQEAIALLKDGRNRLVRKIRRNGNLETHYYDPDENAWRDMDDKIVSRVVRPARVCPRCGCTEFLVTAHVTQGWKVGPDGDFIECTAECEEITHQPDNDDVWVCAKCGYDAAGGDFRAKDERND